MRRHTIFFAPLVAFGLVAAAAGCDSDDPGGTGAVVVPTGGLDAGTATGTADASDTVPPPVGAVANTILGLTSKGSIVRIGLGADGKEEDLGFPKFNGMEVRTVGAIAKGGAGLYALDYGNRLGGNVLIITLPGLDAQLMGADIDYRARLPQKEGLAFGGGALYGSGQFGPVAVLQLDGTLKEYLLRQGNTATDDTQCSTPEDLVWSGSLLAAGSCASATQPDKNGFWVWEYQLKVPGGLGSGGIVSDKIMKYKSPERIVGLGEGAGGLVAVSAQRKLLTLVGTNFIVRRELEATVVDLE